MVFKMNITKIKEKERSFIKFYNEVNLNNHDLNFDINFLINNIFKKLVPIFTEITEDILVLQKKERDHKKIFDSIEEKLSRENKRYND